MLVTSDSCIEKLVTEVRSNMAWPQKEWPHPVFADLLASDGTTAKMFLLGLGTRLNSFWIPMSDFWPQNINFILRSYEVIDLRWPSGTMSHESMTLFQVINAKWMSDSKFAPHYLRKRHNPNPKKSFKVRKVRCPHMTTVDFDWPLKVPNVIVNNEYYVALHVHIHITSKNTDVRKLQALDALREANAAWHDRSFDVISRGSWGQGRAVTFSGKTSKGWTERYWNLVILVR